MATPTMPTGSSSTTPKKRSYSTMAGSVTGETSPSLRRAKTEKSSRQKRPSSSLSPEAVADLQLQKDEVVVDMMEMKEKEELVMEEVPEGQLVVAEPELHEANNKGGAEPHHQPSGIVLVLYERKWNVFRYGSWPKCNIIVDGRRESHQTYSDTKP